MNDKPILDACCGSRMFWFDKQNPNVVFADLRNGTFDSGHGKTVTVSPDIVADFRKMPFGDNMFIHVVFDPPHSKWMGKNSIMGMYYGTLLPTWEADLKAGFDECMRVLKPGGTLIFKWHDKDIKLKRLLSVLQAEPLYGHTSGKHGRTIWMAFMKGLPLSPNGEIKPTTSLTQ